MVLRIGIIGGSGIGYIHARHYHELGAQVVAVMCSSILKADAVAEKLAKEFNMVTAAHDSLVDFLDEDLDAVSICTPASLHIDYIKACFNENIPVFCEKPLFWSQGISPENVCTQLRALENHQNRCLFVNTSNTVFLDAIMQRVDKPEFYNNVCFEFYTTGRYIGMGIAQDLFPHGLSLLIHLLGDCELSNFTSNVFEHTFFCQFRYGECSVTFDFREDPRGPKHMRIGLNENFYSRVQVGQGSNYEVSFISDSTDEIIPAVDPFKIFISRFLDFVASKGARQDDAFYIGALNLSLMARCLNLAEKQI